LAFCFGHFAFLSSMLTSLKEVLMPVLSRACPELVLSEVEGPSRRVEGLIDVNQTKPEFANHPS
jgi:hypothetical protein